MKQHRYFVTLKHAQISSDKNCPLIKDKNLNYYSKFDGDDDI